MVYLSAKDENQLDAAGNAAKNILQARHNNFDREAYTVTNMATYIELLDKVINVFTTFIAAVSAISLVVGGLLGAFAGFYGGTLDNVIMRVMDVLLAIPQTLLAIAIAAALGPGLYNLMIAVGISAVPNYARIVRGSVLSIRGMEYVEAARAVGSSDLRIILRHIIPNSMAPIIVQSTLGVASAILNAAGLSFIGLGIQPPNPEWGVMRLLPMPPAKIISGDIVFEGESLLSKPESQMRAIRGGKIAMIFQDPMTSLDPVVPVVEQIAEMVELHQKGTKADALKRAGDMLELVGIPRERGVAFPHQFSGGMKQRVVIAIALACDPTLLIADEPTTALDVTIQAQVLELMHELKEKFRTSMIMITHDLGIVAEMCDKVAIMYAGRVVEYGTTEMIYNNRLHPYTEGLFNSLPDLESEQEELKVIHGLMPDPTNLPSGCCFHPRCPYATEDCSKNAPEMTEVVPGHFVACPVRTAALKND